jgi:hypothetical protein
MRKLKHHEQKLLRKVDFLQWKSDQNIREIKVQPASKLHLRLVELLKLIKHFCCAFTCLPDLAPVPDTKP